MASGVLPAAGPAPAERTLLSAGRWRGVSVAELAGLAFALACGAYLRLGALEYAQFSYDEAVLWNIVRELARHPGIATRGMHTTMGIDHGPFEAYLLLPGALAGWGPMAAYVTVAVLNVAAIALLWAFARRYWGPRVGFFAVLLYAVNPWAVWYSRRLWGDDMVAPFSILLVWALCDLVARGRRRDSVLPLLWLGIVVQLYVVALVHLPLVAVGFLLAVRRVRLRYFLGGLALFAVLTWPYFTGTVFPSIQALIRVMALGGGTVRVDLTSVSLLFQVVSSAGHRAIAAGESRQAAAEQALSLIDLEHGLPGIVSLASEVFLAVGLLVALGKVIDSFRRQQPTESVPHLLTLVAVLSPVLLLVRHSTAVFSQYLITGFPLLFLLVALGMQQTWRWLARLSKADRQLPALPAAAIAALVALIVGTNLVLGEAFLTDIREYRPNSAYGMPQRYAFEVINTTKALAAREGISRVYLGGASELAEPGSAIALALRPDLPGLTYFDPAESFVWPETGAGKALYALSSATDRVGRAFAAQLGAYAVDQLEFPGPGFRYTFYVVPVSEVARLFPADSGVPVRATFDGLARLESYVVERELRPGQPQEVMLRWTLLGGDGGRPPPYSAYVRLLDSAQRASRIAEFPFYDLAQWQPGEHVVWWRRFPTPERLAPGAYSYLVGLYTATDATTYRNAPVFDPTGAPVGEGVRLGPLAVRSPARPAPGHALASDFGEGIALAGYELAPPEGKPGGQLEVKLYWEARALVERDYTVFVHVLGPDGKLVAQHDGPPASGSYATSAWLAGEMIEDAHPVQLPDGLAAGRYTVEVGLYQPATGERLGGEGFAVRLPIDVEAP